MRRLGLAAALLAATIGNGLLEDVDGLEYCGAHRAWIRFIAAGHLKCSSVIRGGAHYRQPGREIHSVLK